MIINQTISGTKILDTIEQDYPIHSSSENIRTGNLVEFIIDNDVTYIKKSDPYKGIIDGIAKGHGSAGDTITIKTLSGSLDNALSSMRDNEFLEVIE